MVTKYKDSSLSNINKGFTLIELLAVIVILAVIALIATPIILNMIESARKSSAKDSAYGYIKAIEYEASLADLKGKKYEDKEDYTYNEIKVNIKGEAPTGGRYSLKNGVVTSGVFCINGYTVNYTDNTMTVGDKGCTGEDLKYEGKVVLSETQGDYTYPESRTFEVKENLSGGTLSCTTSDSEVATCSIEGNVVTVKPGTKEDSATITIISASTEKYKEAQAAYLVKTIKGTIPSVTSSGYSGAYDGEAHGITISTTLSGATIKYGTEEGKYTLTENPTYKDVGTYTVYYEITKEGYTTIVGKEQVIIIDNIKPSIAFKSTFPKMITKGDSYSIADYLEISYGPSGGTYSCTNNSNTISNLSSLAIGNETITCKAIGKNDLVDSNTINILVFNPDYVSSKAGDLIWTHKYVENYREYYKVNEGWSLYSYANIVLYNVEYTAPLLVSTNEEAVTYETKVDYISTELSSTTVDYLGHKWYISSNGAWFFGDLTSGGGTARKIYATSNSTVFTDVMQLMAKKLIDTALKPTDSENELASKIKLGDYIKMTPTSNSFTTDTSKTGYTSTQTINPSELNLWRVIKVNKNGTIEIVSENVSNTAIYFQGTTGYKNLIGYLNVLANQYQNTKYTINARHIGYNGQTEYLTDTKNTLDSTSTSPPWSCDTGNDCNSVESQGGGDMLYTNDINLVKNAIGTLVSKNLSGTPSTYWLSSRFYNYGSANYWNYFNRNITSSGNIDVYGMYICNSETKVDNYGAYSIRPILTLKTGLNFKGSGTSSDPYVLQ